MDREPLPDYSSTIRAQIEREVEQTKTLIERNPPYARAGSVSIGYVANSHHGLPLFKDGDRLAEVPVRIDRHNVACLTVHSTQGDVKLRR